MASGSGCGPTVRALARGVAHPRRVSLLVGEHRVVCAAATGRWLRACRASSWFTRQGWWLMATAAAQERSSVKSSWRTRAPKRLLSPLRRGRRDSLSAPRSRYTTSPAVCLCACGSDVQGTAVYSLCARDIFLRCVRTKGTLETQDLTLSRSGLCGGSRNLCGGNPNEPFAARALLVSTMSQ